MCHALQVVLKAESEVYLHLHNPVCVAWSPVSSPDTDVVQESLDDHRYGGLVPQRYVGQLTDMRSESSNIGRQDLGDCKVLWPWY